MTTITRILTRDARFRLKPGEGADSVHTDPIYSYAVTRLETDSAHTGTGLAFTVGGGNDLVCRAIDLLAEPLVGREVESLMAEFGAVVHAMENHHQLRWLGPHKGVVHLALASIVNACVDLWAKSRDLPAWKLLLELTPEQLVALLDFSYIEDVLTREQAVSMLRDAAATRNQRSGVIDRGYPGYDTSVGWFHYSDQQIQENARHAVQQGFTAMKLKVGSDDPQRDIRRAQLVRDAVGDDVRIMLDANQKWTLPEALDVCAKLKGMNPYWIEEPTHPDDVLGHKALADAIAPTAVALGEHVPNRVLFKNFMQAGAVKFVQVDAVRVAGVSEFLTVSLMARRFGLHVVPHVGDMGQIHQHRVLVNHIALGLDAIFLEYIPHLREQFVQPCRVGDGVYRTPTEPGMSSDLR